MFEETRALRPRHRRRHRHRLEGDVHLRGPGRAQTSLTLRPEATAGIVRAVIEHNLIQTDPALKVYALGPMFRRERPAEGPLPPVPPGGRGGLRHGQPRVDVEVIEMAVGFLEACGIARARAAAELRGRCHLPARSTWRCCAASCARTRRAALRGQPAPHRDEPAARPRLQGPRGPGRDRRPAQARGPPLAGVPRPLRRGAAAARPPGHPLPARPPAGARPRLLRARRPSRSRAAPWAPRTACWGAAATTAWWRSWAGRRSPASASRWAWSGSPWPCPPPRAESRCDVFLAAPGRRARATRRSCCSARCARPGLAVLMEHEGRELQVADEDGGQAGRALRGHPGRGRDRRRACGRCATCAARPRRRCREGRVLEHLEEKANG